MALVVAELTEVLRGANRMLQVMFHRSRWKTCVLESVYLEVPSCAHGTVRTRSQGCGCQTFLRVCYRMYTLTPCRRLACWYWPMRRGRGVRPSCFSWRSHSVSCMYPRWYCCGRDSGHTRLSSPRSSSRAAVLLPALA